MSGSQICVKNLYLLLHGHAGVKNYPRSVQIDEAKSERQPPFPSDKLISLPPPRSVYIRTLSLNSIAALNLITAHQQQ